jgi:uncharacterized membrane protein YfcA
MELVIGLLIGMAIGATGVGGGTLTAPALIFLLGFSPHVAVATALIFSAAVKVWASGVYLLRGQVNFRVLGRMLAGGLPGAVLGALALTHLKSAKSDNWILVGVGAIVAISALANLLKFDKPRPQTGAAKTYVLPFLALPIGLESGFSSAGSGALGTLVLFNFTSLTPAAVVGTDLVFGMLVSMLAGGVNAGAGNCNWNALALLIPAGIVGSLIGARACVGLSIKTMRQAVLISTACVGLLLVSRGLARIF